MGKKGSSTTVQSYTPTEEEKRLMAQAADYADAVAPNALKLNNIAGDLLYGSYGTVQADYNQMNQAAQNQLNQANAIVGDLTQGVLPSGYQEAMENSIKSGVENSMGSALNNLAARGVLNSSVTNKAMQGISDSAANTMAQQYANNIALQSQLAGQMQSAAGQNIALSAAAQEAAQQPALNLWNASMGLNSGGTGTALAAVAGQGTSTATQSGGGSGLFGGVLTGLAGNPGLFGWGKSNSNSNCFVGDTKVKTPNGETEIKKLRVGDKVICPHVDGTETVETVTEVMTPRYSEVYAVVVNAQDIVGTTNPITVVATTLTQPLLCDNGEFALVKDLTVGTQLRGGKVTGIVHSGERKVYDIKLTGENNYYADGFIAKGAVEEW